MKTILTFVVVGILTLGCIGCNNITPDMANTLAYTSGYASCVVAAKTNIVNQEALVRITGVLATIKPAVDKLTTADTLYDALYAELVVVVNAQLSNEDEKLAALTLGSISLRMAQTWLDNHPDFKAQQTYWTNVVKYSIDGAIQAIKDTQNVDKSIRQMKRQVRP